MVASEEGGAFFRKSRSALTSRSSFSSSWTRFSELMVSETDSPARWVLRYFWNHRHTELSVTPNSLATSTCGRDLSRTSRTTRSLNSGEYDLVRFATYLSFGQGKYLLRRVCP